MHLKQEAFNLDKQKMILKVTDLTIFRQQQAVISDLNFVIEPAQRLFLQGEIGAGKSTLLHALLGFVPIQQGNIEWFGQQCKTEADFSRYRGTVGICFQNADDQLFCPTVLDDVAFGVQNQGVSKAVAEQIALTQLEQLDIAYLKDRPIHLLSGGEKNFTALAGVLAMKPKVLLLDEPTNGLDSKNISKLTELLKSLKLPMVVASHDMAFTHSLADTQLLL